MKIESQLLKENIGKQKKERLNSAPVQDAEGEHGIGNKISKHKKTKDIRKKQLMKQVFKRQAKQLEKRMKKQNSDLKNKMHEEEQNICSQQKQNSINNSNQLRNWSFVPEKQVQKTKYAKFIDSQCVDLMDMVLDKKIQNTVNKIFKTILQNIKEKNSIMIVLHLKRSQQDDLDRFIHYVNKYDFKPNRFLNSIHYQTFSKEDVKQVAQYIHSRQNELRNSPNSVENAEQLGIDLQTHLSVYVPKQVTNLTKQNINVFQQTIISGHYAVILPTFQDQTVLDDQNMQDNGQNHKLNFQFYNDKQAFAQFFYRCIVSKNVMAYLPSQSLELIKLFDSCPISYEQACNMLIYACQLYDHKRRQLKKPQQNLVFLKQPVRAFNSSWKKLFGVEAFSDQMAEYNYQQICNCFLNQQAIYNVNKDLIQGFLDIYVQGQFDKNLYVNRLLQLFQKILKDNLSEQLSLVHLVEQMELFDQKKANFSNQIEFFQSKIAHIFKVASQEVRKQAKYVPWNQMNVLNLVDLKKHPQNSQ